MIQNSLGTNEWMEGWNQSSPLRFRLHLDSMGTVDL